MAISKIRRKKGFVYRVKVPLPGEKVATRCFDRKIDAEKWEAQVKSNLRVAAQEEIRFEDFAVKFIKLCAEPNMENPRLKSIRA